MRRSLPAAIVGLTALAAATACADSEGGTAKAQATTTVSTTESTSVKPSSSRPREIKLDGKNPCELMTSDQLAQIGKTTTPRPGTNKTFNSPNCVYTATGAFWDITTVVTSGIEFWTETERKARPAAIPPIEGFPAITVTDPSDRVSCSIAVDTAGGQYLFASFEVSKSFEDHFPKPCDGARQVAEAAMQNLTK
ncbi:MAG TPA: DUF3558 domain-containing protein [Glaciihabitans sp.]|jgi:hypothetical protein|nr:DUF3558 domain-containing protein [Glaciihabitans sp.]